MDAKDAKLEERGGDRAQTKDPVPRQSPSHANPAFSFHVDGTPKPRSELLNILFPSSKVFLPQSTD
jgi:hypothetical protein